MADDRYSRQSFLGEGAQESISKCVVGIVGLGGGGSHVVQQLAHVGFQNYVLFDADIVKLPNLNRLVGATEQDAKLGTPKVEVAERVIKGLQPGATVLPLRTKWQLNVEALRDCDLVFGCVDGMSERDQLEAALRRLQTPYIDIGLDVHCEDNEPPLMGGQVFLSMPGEACMRCVGMINDRALSVIHEQYGDAGIHPQVVWANGSLTSAAVGIAVNLVTGWAQSLSHPVYLEYRGNHNTLTNHTKLKYLNLTRCEHYSM